MLLHLKTTCHGVRTLRAMIDMSKLYKIHTMLFREVLFGMRRLNILGRAYMSPFTPLIYPYAGGLFFD